jgi:hypothetical protein
MDQGIDIPDILEPISKPSLLHTVQASIRETEDNSRVGVHLLSSALRISVSFET